MQPDPYEQPLASFGRAALFVPLIIGGAVIVSLVMLWEAHAREARLADVSRNEVAAKNHLRDSWAALRAGRPAEALEKTAAAAQCVAALDDARGETLQTDYAELKVSLLLLEAESLFRRDGAAGAGAAEAKFDEALGIMTFSSGELWETGLLGRARVRLARGDCAGAVADLDHIMTRNAGYGAAYYYRALAKEKAGDAAGAAADERAARRLGSWPPLRDVLPANQADRTAD